MLQTLTAEMMFQEITKMWADRKAELAAKKEGPECLPEFFNERL
jgi:hypothetical protein